MEFREFRSSIVSVDSNIQDALYRWVETGEVFVLAGTKT